ncbi:MAG: VOC family protein [Longimicrobiales bacterium]|nr:VOC family protein [Longimicrobiales bacterium]
MPSHPFDHVAVAVRSIEESRALFELVTGQTCSPVEELPSQGVDVAFVGSVELLEPREPDTPVGRFLERNGPGLHHVAFRVPNLERAVEEFESRGLRAVGDGIRPGARGHRVAFLHPASTGKVLIELVEGTSTSG